MTFVSPFSFLLPPFPSFSPSCPFLLSPSPFVFSPPPPLCFLYFICALPLLSLFSLPPFSTCFLFFIFPPYLLASPSLSFQIVFPPIQSTRVLGPPPPPPPPPLF